MRWSYWFGLGMVGVPLAALIVAMCIRWPWATLLFAWGFAAIVLIERGKRY